MTGSTFNQNHSGSGDNIINYGQQPFRLTEHLLINTALKIGGAKDVRVHSYGPSSEASDFVVRLQATLGRHVIHEMHVGMSNDPPAKGIHVDADGYRAIVRFNPT